MTYPITDIILEEYEDLEHKETWEDILYNNIGIRNLLIRIGLSYNVFGNAIGSINLKFRRYLRCQHCKEESPLDDIKKRKFTSFKYKGICPKCSKENENFKIVDVSLKTPESVKIILWAPERLDIVYNEFTGESTYYYDITTETKKAIKNGNLDIVDEQPAIFIDAVKNNKKIKLDPSNIFHLKQPTLPEDDQGWGKPIILPAMGLIYYMQILRRGNEAIAWEHVVPLRILFPASTTNLDPLAASNLGQWRARIEAGIKLWKTDPNHIIVCPIPLGFQNVGGDARALMVTPELKFSEESVINSVGVPVEFVKGGASWTGSSISLRIVENGFLSYREDLDKLCNKFLIPKIASLLSIVGIHLRLRRLRMQDDAETKGLFMNLNAGGKISDTTLYNEFGIDAEVERKNRKKEIESTNEFKKLAAEGDANAAGAVAAKNARSQAEAEWAYVDQKARIDEKLFEEELSNEMSNEKLGIGEFDPSVALHKWALEMLTVPPEEQKRLYNEMLKKIPTALPLVMKRVQLIQANMMQSMQALVQSQDAEEDREVKREQITAKKAKDKHTAQKRGTP